MKFMYSGEIFTTDEIKPLKRLLKYREICIAATETALGKEKQARILCPACASHSEPVQLQHSLPYRRCLECGSLFLEAVPSLEDWSMLSEETSRWLYPKEGPDDKTIAYRREHIYEPKASWIAHSLMLFGHDGAEGVTLAPLHEDFSRILSERLTNLRLHCVNETQLVSAYSMLPIAGRVNSPQAMARSLAYGREISVVILLEGLDRSRDPSLLLEAVSALVPRNALLFLTALMASGFELLVLDSRCVYLFPPDKAHCLSRRAIERMLEEKGFEILESSTPGVLDCDSVIRHIRSGVAVPLSRFEGAMLAGSDEERKSFQDFLQFARLSSFGRFVARRL